ncbi:unnamed protein product [Owenia fusiformis]|uniref:Uncharacterized protein n=1 Tax=Owenia fusiformis TaxID=6347 RepID=A0A8J1YBC5_OWEFU|nr:unnamed protein product [Owenia fusiformis]
MDERFNTIWNTGSNNMQPNDDSLYGIFDLCDQEDTDVEFVAANKKQEGNIAEDDLPDIEVPNERQHKFSGGQMWSNCNPSTTAANKNIKSVGAAICNRTNRRIFSDVSPKIVVSPSMSSDDDDLLVNHLQLAETSINSAHHQNATTWNKSTESECAISPMTTDLVMSQESPIIGHMISERAVEPSSFVTHSLKPADDYDNPTADISNQSASKCPDRFEASMVRNDPNVVHTSLPFPRRDHNVAPTSMFAASLGNEKDLNEAEETFDNIFSGIF